MIDFCQFGAGRIGAIHAKNITGHPNARLRVVVDPDRAAAERLAGRHGAAVGSQAEALADRAVKAVSVRDIRAINPALVAELFDGERQQFLIDFEAEVNLSALDVFLGKCLPL